AMKGTQRLDLTVGVVLVVFFACPGVFAGESGSPLDCSDWVPSKPGFTCVSADQNVGYYLSYESRLLAMDNESRVLSASRFGSASGPSILVNQYSYSVGTTEQIGYFASRSQGGISFPIYSDSGLGRLLFDEKTGTL